MPTSWAITPPRSMSPARTTGTSRPRRRSPCWRCRPARRLTSAGLPAPSTRTRSAPARKPGEALQHARQQLRLQRVVVAGAAAASAPGPARRPAPRSRSRGLSSTGFMSTSGSTPQARACSACARPISPPSAVTAALLLMFCGLNGRTRRPRRVKARHRPGHQQRLAGVRAGALDHQSAHGGLMRERQPTSKQSAARW